MCVCVCVCVCVCRQNYAPLIFFVLVQYTLFTRLRQKPGVSGLFQVISDDAQLPSVLSSVPHQDLTARLPSNQTVNLNSPHYTVSQYPHTSISVPACHQIKQ